MDKGHDRQVTIWSSKYKKSLLSVYDKLYHTYKSKVQKGEEF